MLLTLLILLVIDDADEPRTSDDASEPWQSAQF
jgi:hypothetical protein